jgi:hypothetical protein
VLTWRSVFTDTNGGREVVSYQIHRGDADDFAPGPLTLLATVTPGDFGSLTGEETYTDTNPAGVDSYRVVPVNGAGQTAADLPLPHLLPYSVAGIVPAQTSNFTVNLNPGSSVFYTDTEFVSTYIATRVYTGTQHPSANAAMLNRYYEIGTNAETYSARLCLSYDQTEVPVGIDEDRIRLCRWDDGPWSCPDRSAVSDATANVVCAENIDMLFGEWTLGAVGPTVVTVRDLQAADRTSTPIGLVLVPVVLFGVALIAARKRVLS